MPALFRSFLPLENPIGFGFQDFVEFGFALLVVVLTLILSRIARRRGALQLLPVLTALVSGHFLFGWSVRQLRTVPRTIPKLPSVGIERRAAPPTPAIPTPIPKRTEPVKKKQVSPFEEVK